MKSEHVETTTGSTPVIKYTITTADLQRFSYEMSETVPSAYHEKQLVKINYETDERQHDTGYTLFFGQWLLEFPLLAIPILLQKLLRASEIFIEDTDNPVLEITPPLTRRGCVWVRIATQYQNAILGSAELNQIRFCSQNTFQIEPAESIGRRTSKAVYTVSKQSKQGTPKRLRYSYPLVIEIAYTTPQNRKSCTQYCFFSTSPPQQEIARPDTAASQKINTPVITKPTRPYRHDPYNAINPYRLV